MNFTHIIKVIQSQRMYYYPHFIGENIVEQLIQGYHANKWQSWDLDSDLQVQNQIYLLYYLPQEEF